MKKLTLTAGFATGVALAVIVALTGCAPAVYPNGKAGSSHPSPHSSGKSTPKPTPVATLPPLGPLPANALFRITATVTEAGGASADLVQTVFAPAAPTASDVALLNAQCNFPGDPGWASNYTSPQFVTTTFTSTLHPGSKAWPSDDTVAAYFGGDASAYSGAYEGAQAACSSGYILIPGTMHGVTPVDASDPANGTHGWASQFGMYGFDGSGNYPGAEDQSGTGVVKNCKIEESAAAKAASPVVEAWLTQPFDLQNGCVFQGANAA